MLIDCDTCAVRGPACGDCVVTVLLGAPPAVDRRGAAQEPDGLDLDPAEQAAIAVLAGSGLVPPLRLVPAEQERAEREAGDLPRDGTPERTTRRGPGREEPCEGKGGVAGRCSAEAG